MPMPRQHPNFVAERESYRILEQVLPAGWIYRYIERHQDFGIDVEIEPALPNGVLVGTPFKAQIKSKSSICRGNDGKIRFSGIKQSTMEYWCALGMHTPVVLFLVDRGSGDVFWAPVFWQATSLMGRVRKTATFTFLSGNLKGDDVEVQSLIQYVSGSTVLETIELHKRALADFPHYLLLYSRCEDRLPYLNLNEDFNELSGFLKTAVRLTLPKDHADDVLTKLYAIQRDGGLLTYEIGKEIMDRFLPDLFNVLGVRNGAVLAAEGYWSTANPEYLASVRESSLPISLHAGVRHEWISRYFSSGP